MDLLGQRSCAHFTGKQFQIEPTSPTAPTPNDHKLPYIQILFCHGKSLGSSSFLEALPRGRATLLPPFRPRINDLKGPDSKVIRKGKAQDKRLPRLAASETGDFLGQKRTGEEGDPLSCVFPSQGLEIGL